MQFFRFALLTALLLIIPTWASAFGLGSPLTSPTLGQPLRIEIPLHIAAGEPLPRADCVRVAPPAGAPEQQFFPHNARAIIDGTENPRIVVLATQPVNGPLIEFRLIVGCNGEFAKNYLVLTSGPDTASGSTKPNLPTQAAPSPAPNLNASSPAAALPMPAQSATPVVSMVPTVSMMPTVPMASPEKPKSAENTLKLNQDTNLNTLARQRYPDDIDARDEFRRRVAKANPALFQGAARLGSTPLAAGTQLVMPTDLPTNNPAAKSVADRAVTSSATKTPPANASRTSDSTTANDRPRQPARDKLVIGGSMEGAGGAGKLTAKELVSSVDRMSQMLEEQGRAEQKMTENLNALTAAFVETKNYLQTIEANNRRLEAEQRQLQTRLDSLPKQKDLGIFELLGLILACGAVGAGLLLQYHRMQLQRLRYSSGLPDDGSVQTAPPSPRSHDNNSGNASPAATQSALPRQPSQPSLRTMRQQQNHENAKAKRRGNPPSTLSATMEDQEANNETIPSSPPVSEYADQLQSSLRSMRQSREKTVPESLKVPNVTRQAARMADFAGAKFPLDTDTDAESLALIEQDTTVRNR